MGAIDSYLSLLFRSKSTYYIVLLDCSFDILLSKSLRSFLSAQLTSAEKRDKSWSDNLRTLQPMATRICDGGNGSRKMLYNYVFQTVDPGDSVS
jgi:hypothetical protein